MASRNKNSKDKHEKNYSLVRQLGHIDNPILRHFIKKNNLNDKDSLVLDELLNLTNQMKTSIKTTYKSIAESVNLPTLDTYHSIQSLHRYRIIEYKPSDNFVHISFEKIDDSIEEIFLAHRNAKKIKDIQETLARMIQEKYIPADDLFDLIYPILGKIISAQIAEAFRSMVNYLNDRLDSSFSIKMWGYRLKSFQTKIPLAEIILRESLPFYVEEIFLLEKKTSLLLAHSSRTDEESIDKDLVGGMLSAINDFVKTSFTHGKDGFSEISFGESKIIITENLYFFSAVVVYGAPDLSFINQINSTNNDIHLLYRRQLKNFNGSMEKLTGIEKPLNELINTTNETDNTESQDTKSLKKIKIVGVLALLLIISGTTWHINSFIRDAHLAHKITSIIESSLPPYSNDIAVTVDGKNVFITGTISSRKTGEKISAIIKKHDTTKVVYNRAIVTDYRSVYKFKNKLQNFQKELNFFKLIAVRQELEKITIEFDTGATQIRNPQKLQVQRAYEILKPYPEIHVDIIAFNDPSGGIKINKQLAEKRIQAVNEYLQALGIKNDRLNNLKFSPDILFSDPRFKLFKDRRGIMLFAKSSDQLPQ